MSLDFLTFNIYCTPTMILPDGFLTLIETTASNFFQLLSVMCQTALITSDMS